MRKNDKERTELDVARRAESKAHNELEYLQRQAEEQKSQLDALLLHREECMEGLKAARETGLTPVHVREFQLLMTHINSVVETIEHKVMSSQDKYDKAKESWQEKHEDLVRAKEVLKQALIPDEETEDEEETDGDMKAADDAEVNHQYYGDKIIPVQHK